MNGIHDLGGMHGFGRVPKETEDDPKFPERWEAQTFAINGLVLQLGLTNIDAFRHALERLDPVSYFGDGYYGRWLAGAEKILLEEGCIASEELSALRERLARGEDVVSEPPAQRLEREAREPRPDDYVRDVEAAPRFEVGDEVVTKNIHPPGHTRLPGYAKGKRGTVVAYYRAQVFPDTHAHGLGEDPQHLYAVRFEGEELWGDDAEPGTSVCLDLFEPYFE